jgi:hypothetical protein
MKLVYTASALAYLLVAAAAAPTSDAPIVDLGYVKYFGNSNATLG